MATPNEYAVSTCQLGHGSSLGWWGKSWLELHACSHADAGFVALGRISDGCGHLLWGVALEWNRDVQLDDEEEGVFGPHHRWTWYGNDLRDAWETFITMERALMLYPPGSNWYRLNERRAVRSVHGQDAVIEIAGRAFRAMLDKKDSS